MPLREKSYRVSICKFADFGEPTEKFTTERHHGLSYDELTVDGRVPRFSFYLKNNDGISSSKWDHGDIVEIFEGEELKHRGKIIDLEPSSDSQSGAVLHVSGIHYYYARLFEVMANSSSEFNDGNAVNLWRFGRKVDGSDMIDGVNVGDVVRTLTGNRLFVQDFFDTLDMIANNDWVRNFDEFTNITAAAGFTQENFTDGHSTTTWKLLKGTDVEDVKTYVGDRTYDNNSETNTWRGTIADGAAAPWFRARIASDDEIVRNQTIGVYQDDITLNAGDILTSRIRSASGIRDDVTASIAVFANNSFNHPVTSTQNAAQIVSNRIGGITTSGGNDPSVWGKLGGEVAVPEDGTYRVVFMFRYTGESAAQLQHLTGTDTDLDVRLGRVRVLQNDTFNSVSLEDGQLQLKTLSTEAGGTRTFAKSGNIESISLKVGNENIRKAPDIFGNAEVALHGEKYSTFDPTVELSRDNGSTWNSVPLDFDSGKWTGTYDFGAPSEGKNTLKVRISLTGDGDGTTKIDYYRVIVPVESYTREIKIENGQQAYRGDKTGISQDLSGIEDYTYPSTLEPDATENAKLSTTATEFFQQSLFEGILQTLENTLKTPELDSNDLPNLPENAAYINESINWDFQIDNDGRPFFSNHIGEYFGRLAAQEKRKTYSFEDRNIKLLRSNKSSEALINNLVYIGQGVAGFNSLVLNGNEFRDDASVNKYGLRTGRITEKKTFDAMTARNRARALLRKRASPTVKLSVEILPGFRDTWNVGDIIHIRDYKQQLNSDFRVLSKKVVVDDTSGVSYNIELSNKTETITEAFGAMGEQVRALQSTNQGSAVSIATSPNSSVISRELPFVLPVDIPVDAKDSLHAVFLDLLSEPVFNTGESTSAESEHTHEVPGSEHGHSLQGATTQGASTLGSLNDSLFEGTIGSGVSINRTVPSGSITATLHGSGTNPNTGWIRIRAWVPGSIVFDKTFDGAFNAIGSIAINTSWIGQTMTIRADRDSVSGSPNVNVGVRFYGLSSHSHGFGSGEATKTETPDGVASKEGSAHTHGQRFRVRYNRDSDGNLLFPVNIKMSINDKDGIGRSGIAENSGPYAPFGTKGVNELGDLHDNEDDSSVSQETGVGFVVEKMDISDAFKNSDGTWLPGRHYIYFNAVGADWQQVNADNLGLLRGGITYERAARTTIDDGAL